MAALIRIMKYELRIMVFFFAIILASLFIIHPVYAQAATPASSFQLPTSIPPDPSTTLRMGLPSNVSPTSPLYTDLLVNNLFHSFSCLAIGQSMIGQPCLTYQVTKNAQGMLQGVPVLSQTNLSGGALGATTSLIGALYQNPPVRTVDYLASVGAGLGIVKTANAQVVGSGAAVLNPILKLWQVSRNISYVIMIIIFVIIGLMVMFRNRINPQTVITAQAALPGLVIGLILITFSYFLAGLVSDMAFIGTNVVGYYFSTAQGKPPQDLVGDINNNSIIALFSSLIPDDANPFNNNQSMIANAIGQIINNASPGVSNFLRFAAAVMAFQQGNLIGHAIPVIGDLAGIVGGLVASGVSAVATPQIMGMILAWAAMAILIYSMIKLLLNLIKTYLTIIFLTITAPFQLLISALPGRQGIATGWILSMLANVLVFPAVLAVLYFVAFILGPDLVNEGCVKNQQTQKCVFDISRLNQVEGSKIIPAAYAANGINISSGNTFPLLGGLNTGFINYLLAFGALVALPAIPEIINRTLGRASAAGQLLGQEIGGNIQGGRGYSNQWNQFAGGVQKIGQDYNKFRGEVPGYSPSLQTGMASWPIPRRIPWIGGRQPFARKETR